MENGRWRKRRRRENEELKKSRRLVWGDAKVASIACDGGGARIRGFMYIWSRNQSACAVVADYARDRAARQSESRS